MTDAGSGQQNGDGPETPNPTPPASNLKPVADPPNWAEKATLGVLAATLIAAGAAALESDRLARATERALVDSRESARQSHIDAINAENLTADALGMAQSNGNQNHQDTQLALGKSDAANGIAQRTAAANQRAWVSPTDMVFDGGFTNGQPIKVRVPYLNSGHEPATNFVPTLRFVPFTKEDWNNGNASASITQSASQCFSERLNPKAPKGMTTRAVFPGIGTTPFIIRLKSDDASQTSKVLFSDEFSKGDKIIVLLGCFFYQSVGRVHHTSFCGYYKSDEAALPEMNICTVGNNAD